MSENTSQLISDLQAAFDRSATGGEISNREVCTLLHQAIAKIESLSCTVESLRVDIENQGGGGCD